MRDGGCYGHVDGPRFNTRAEIRGLALAGVTAVSQTAGPETVLAGEAELPYALVGYATDYANGVQAEPTPVARLLELIAASTEAFGRLFGGGPAAVDGRAGARRRRVPLPRRVTVAVAAAGPCWCATAWPGRRGAAALGRRAPRGARAPRRRLGARRAPAPRRRPRAG